MEEGAPFSFLGIIGLSNSDQELVEDTSSASPPTFLKPSLFVLEEESSPFLVEFRRAWPRTLNSSLWMYSSFAAMSSRDGRYETAPAALDLSFLAYEKAKDILLID